MPTAYGSSKDCEQAFWVISFRRKKCCVLTVKHLHATVRILHFARTASLWSAIQRMMTECHDFACILDLWTEANISLQQCVRVPRPCLWNIHTYKKCVYISTTTFLISLTNKAPIYLIITISHTSDPHDDDDDGSPMRPPSAKRMPAPEMWYIFSYVLHKFVFTRCKSFGKHT
jgi:hypothetical protein